MSTPIFTSANPAVVATSDVFEIGGGIVENHAFEIEITDANASITALSIDFYFTVTDGRASASEMYLKRTHPFTAGQLSDLKHMVVIEGQPATAVAVGINSITGAGAGDVVEVTWHAKDQT